MPDRLSTARGAHVRVAPRRATLCASPREVTATIFQGGVLLLIAVTALAQSSPRIYPDVGTPLSQAEIQSFDRMIGPAGKELPPGRGTAKEGAEIFAKRCEVCHGSMVQLAAAHARSGWSGLPMEIRWH